MCYMVLFIERCYVRPTEGSATCGAQEIDATEIIGFAEGVFRSCIRFLDGEEFLGDRDVAFLHTHQSRIKASGDIHDIENSLYGTFSPSLERIYQPFVARIWRIIVAKQTHQQQIYCPSSDFDGPEG